MISKGKIEEVLSKANIVDFVQERVDLKTAGANYKAICPFHDEKTPSMMVSESKQIFKCFGCGAGGNVLNFIMQYEGLTYPEAIRFVAEKVNVEIIEERISEEDQEILNELDKKREQLYSVLNKANQFFHYQLLDEIEDGSNKLLLNYLKKRNISKGIVEHFKLGYAPDSWNSLLNDSNFNQIDKDLLIDAGLCKKNDKNRFYDFFRKRLMFPIYDSFGNTIAFSGRVLSADDIPKYLNSPDSSVYKKKSVLFGFFQAKESIRKQKSAILVEGNLDQVSLYKFGFTNVVASCGTAYTEEHARFLKRNSDEIIIILDSDNAGYKASLKAIKQSLKYNLNVKLVDLPKGEDPDSFLEKFGTKKFQDLLDNRIEFIDYYLLHNDISNLQSKILVAKNVLESINEIKDNIVQEVYLNDLALKTTMSISVLKNELHKLQTTSTQKTREPNKNIQTDSNHEKFIYNATEESEFSIIYLMMKNKKAYEKLSTELNPSYFNNKYVKNIFTSMIKMDNNDTSLAEILLGVPEKFSFFFTNYYAKNEELYDPDFDDFNDKIDIAIKDNFNIISKLYCKQKKAILGNEAANCENPDRLNEIVIEIQRIADIEKELKK